MDLNVITYLLVEDDPVERAKFDRYNAEHKDFSCLAYAESVEEALNKTLELHPNMVILDLKLVKSYGMDYLNQLNAMKLPDSPAVFVLTSVTGQSTIKSVRGLRVEEIFLKDDLDGYAVKGPAAVFDFVNLYLRNRILDGVGKLSTVPELMKKKEGKAEALGTYCEERGQSAANKQTEYVIATVLELLKHRRKYFVLRRIAEKIAIEQFNNANPKTVIQGLRDCTTAMWDNFGEHSIKKDYEKVHLCSPDKGMPELKRLLVFIADRFR